MQQLSGQDASFLYLDSHRAHMGVAALYIYDQSSAPGGRVRFKDILKHIEDRLHTSRIFRQKLANVPLNLDYPYWIEDKDFDLEYHVRHIALPEPRDWRQFCIQIARIHSRPLDMMRPLWEMYVIEGLDNIPTLPKGSYAIFTKMHHAAIDGHTGAELTAGLHDISAEPETPRPGKAWVPEEEPGTIGLLARAAINTIKSPFRLAPALSKVIPGVAKMGSQYFTDFITGASSDIPWTRFNGEVSTHRVFEGRAFDLEEVRAIKNTVVGATVNDVILTICGGAMRRYLDAKGELPEQSLVAWAPVNVRREEEYQTAGNQVSMMEVKLRSDIEDPLERLQAVHEATSSSKELTNAIGAREMTDINKHVPSAMLGLAARLVTEKALLSKRVVCNCIITNVPGPQIPLYMNGVKMVYLSGCGPVLDGIGLIIPVVSYNGKIAVTLTACREMMPDPNFFAQCLQDAFDALKATALPPKTKASAASRRKRSAKSARPAE